jgi:hypothetical protein
MLSQKMPNPISSITEERPLPVLTDRARAFIAARLARGESPERIAAGLHAHFAIAIAPAQVIPYWQGEAAAPMPAGCSADKESVQLPADHATEPLFTRVMPEAQPEAARSPFSIALEPETLSVAANEDDAPTTQTGHRQDAGPLQLPADAVDAPLPQDDALQALGDLVKARLGLAPDSAAATQTGRRQNQKAPSALTDEVKAFIVSGLARFETPTRVAAAVQAQFGIEIDRRQVFAYDPAGSRRPAQRWIDLHAATRAKFLQATAEIGIAHKVVRLRMLDRYANRCDAAYQPERAAAFLAQAAKECGGFYERYQRSKTA